MRKARKKFVAGGGIVFAALAIGFGVWLSNGLGTAEGFKSSLIRLDKPTSMDGMIRKLADLQLINNAEAYRLYSQVFGSRRIIAAGTYRVQLNRGPNGVLRSFELPLAQMVRLPETNWARRNANLLEKAEVCDAEEYMRLVRQPALFKDAVSFPLPSTSLEGYLYPDTYNLPPLLGAKGVVIRQLQAFEKRVWEGLDHPQPLDRLVRIASLVELETKFASEKPLVAGLIENRIRKGMRLQIDASINYGLQKWRPLLRSEYKTVLSPYNLYLHDGLPPTPICSPTAASIKAAIHPQNHENLYYVALPNGHSLFSPTFEEHRLNISKRKAAIRALSMANASSGAEATQ